MNQDPDNSNLPAQTNSRAIQPVPGPEANLPMGYLPRTDPLDPDEKISIAREEGYDPMAIELALMSEKSNPGDQIRLVGLTVIAAVLIFFLFPTERFFKPKTKNLGTMTIGGPTLQSDFRFFADNSEPWVKVLLEIDRLYFREGKLSDAIAFAESALEKVPENKWEKWEKVHYRYWELLSSAGKIHSLKTSSRAYLQSFPEDPFANYYYARAFLAAAEHIRHFTKEMQQSYRQEALEIIDRIERACNALKARSKHPDGAGEKDSDRLLYRKLRLEQAKLYTLIWRLGGYQEDHQPDVVYRDKALDICNSAELATLKEAKELRKLIYTHILAHWYWFEGQQVIQGMKHKRRQIEQEVKALTKELREAEEL